MSRYFFIFNNHTKSDENFFSRFDFLPFSRLQSYDKVFFYIFILSLSILSFYIVMIIIFWILFFYFFFFTSYFLVNRGRTTEIIFHIRLEGKKKEQKLIHKTLIFFLSDRQKIISRRHSDTRKGEKKKNSRKLFFQFFLRQEK